VRTPRPGSSTPYGIPWSNVSRYAGIFARQGARAGVDPLLLAAMAIVESDATHHRANGQVVVRGSDGYDNHPAVGMMQVKPAYHQWRDPGADAYTPEGNVRLAALIIADGIKQYGTWERALTTLYFPGDDVNGTTQGGYVATVRALMKEMGSTQEPAPTPAPERTTYVAHTLPGTNETFWLPHWIRFRERLTPPGPNRQQHPMRPTVTVFHTTNNNNPSTGAWHHADRWQAQGTPGHPDGKVGVHAYVDAKEVVWTIPINEKGVHSGDWRNDWGIAIERTTNSDQDQVEAENNAMHVHAGLLHVLGKTARDAMYPHTHNAEGHCPRLTRPWSEVERIVDERIKRIAKEDV
ncbi:MAG TPA: transglycosylase SLT domain-containing protein, partial [Armatimonadota bacterium]|nr:transglycosylase SLT domain-containing protein [Armatimonadota bacterium]